MVNVNAQEKATENPFFGTYGTPYEVPNFDKIKPEHYLPAFEKGMAEQKAAIEKMFSDIKSVLKLHPLRVWNDYRVRGFILLKVICLLLLSLLQMEQQELRNIAKSTIVLMLKNLTVVMKISETGAKTVLGYSCSDKILAKIFCLKS